MKPNSPRPLDTTLRAVKAPPPDVNRNPMPLAGTTRSATNSKRGTQADPTLRDSSKGPRL